MKDSIFRKYDIRGKVGSELQLDRVYDLGRAIAFYFLQRNPNMKTVAIGMDGRTHSPAIKKDLCAALQDSGLDVVFVGTCPSPVLYFACYTCPIDAGIMITASHNPGEYNGFKMLIGTSGVWGDQVAQIKDLFHKKKSYFTKRSLKDKRGKYLEDFMVEPYVDWLVEKFSNLVGSDISVLVDCGNGAAGTTMPLLIQKMKWHNVKLLFEEVDGTYPNHEADPANEKNMQALKGELAINSFDFGAGLDGDCDRMAPMTKNGFLVPGDQLLALFAQDIVRKNPGAAVVFDIKSSSGLLELLKQWDAKPCMSATGHALVKQAMKKNNALLAGELSCHFMFKDRHFGFDDGIYALLRLFEIILQSGKTLQELVGIFPKKFSSTEYRISCDDTAKWDIVDGVKNCFANQAGVKVMTIDGVRAEMENGWGIVRASNTQPALSMRFESDSKDGLCLVKKDFFEALEPYFDGELLKKEMEL